MSYAMEKIWRKMRSINQHALGMHACTQGMILNKESIVSHQVTWEGAWLLFEEFSGFE